MKLKRRSLFLAAPVLAAAMSPARASLMARDLGLIPNSGSDVTAALQSAMSRAAVDGLALELDAGDYLVSDLAIPSDISIHGHNVRFVLSGGSRLITAQGASNVHVSGINFDGQSQGIREDNPALVAVLNCENVTIENCSISNFEGNGLFCEYSAVSVRNSRFSGLGQTAIHLQNGFASQATNNRIANCGNGGIRVWRYEKGFDGTLISGNQISDIRSDWGDGQNGNGVNVFYADGVIVSQNVIRDCHLSAIRANSTKDTLISSNQCHNSLEVGIFSEFEFSGSIISNNMIDGAATGVSITNLDDDGHLAVCSGNIVRNITPFSPTNPDTIPIGIYAEAEVAVTGNVIEDVPGACIAAGYGSFLRNVNISDNILRRARIGIAVSVVEGSGAVHISNNLIAEMQDTAIAGYEWQTQVTKDVSGYAHVSLGDNRIT